MFDISQNTSIDDYYFRMGLNRMLNEVIETEDVGDEGDREKDSEDSKKPLSDFDALKSGLLDPKDKEEDENGEIIKNDDAVDYSDITELSEDCPKTPPLEKSDDKKESISIDIQDLEDAIPATTVQAGVSSLSSANRDDKELMPPPSIPVRNQNNTTPDVNSKNQTDSTQETDIKTEKGKYKRNP